MNVVIANSNPIHSDLEARLIKKYDALCINQKEELKKEFLDANKPEYIFFLHWSFIIPSEIFQNFTCVVFHMTDLPFGRGGSPLQNLIAQGFEDTQISAIKVDGGIDTGPIYMKEPLSLLGTAEEIFLRFGFIVEKMIDQIVKSNPLPIPQEGDVVIFKRRRPNQSSINDPEVSNLKKLYDFIRMLDAEGYPKAFLETDHFRFEFSRASLKKDGIIADVRITEK